MSRHYKLTGNSYLSLAGNNLNYFEIKGRSTTTASKAQEKFSDWQDNTLDVGDFKVLPFGIANDIPDQIQNAVLPNGFANRALKRKAELLVEQGAYLYQERVDGQNYFREPVIDAAITEALEAFNYEELLHKNAIDFYFSEVIFNKIFRSVGSRLGGYGALASIEHVTAKDCRLAYRKNASSPIPTHIIVGDWVKNDKQKMSIYPIFDPLKPTQHRVSIHFKRMPSFGSQAYPVPDIYGNLPWIRNHTNTPVIFENFANNALNIKWHIQSPQQFWDDKRKILQDNCKAASPVVEYKESMLEDLKTEILDKLSELLSGVENVGKFWHNEYVVTLIGANATEMGWKITPIEQKTKEWVESQIKVHETAIASMQAGLGLHQSLAMVGADGKSDSGSEQYYAYAIHQRTATPIPEFYVCKSINDFIKTNFNKNIKVGFFRTAPERHQDITNSQRMIKTTT